MINAQFWDVVPKEQQDLCPAELRQTLDSGAPVFIDPLSLWVLPSQMNGRDGKFDALGGVQCGLYCVAAGIDRRGENPVAWITVYLQRYTGEHGEHLHVPPENIMHRSACIFELKPMIVKAQDALGQIG